jgi:hypothetical protein
MASGRKKGVYFGNIEKKLNIVVPISEQKAWIQTRSFRMDCYAEYNLIKLNFAFYTFFNSRLKLFYTRDSILDSF